MLLVPSVAAVAGNLDKGTDLLVNNKPAEAVVYLERAVIEDPANAEAYYRLGLVYEQLKQYDKSIAALRSAIDRGYPYKDELLARMAKIAALKGDQDQSIAYNSQALQEKPDLSQAVLNRANSLFRKEKYDEAVADYRKFLEIAPASPLKPDVVRMIQAILGLQEERVAAKKAEELRLAEEAARKAEEARQQKLAAEQKQQEEARMAEQKRQEEARRLADEAARKKMLDDLFSSLNAASTEQKNLSAGAEDVQNKQNDLNLEE